MLANGAGGYAHYTHVLAAAGWKVRSHAVVKDAAVELHTAIGLAALDGAGEDLGSLLDLDVVADAVGDGEIEAARVGGGVPLRRLGAASECSLQTTLALSPQEASR